MQLYIAIVKEELANSFMHAYNGSQFIFFQLVICNIIFTIFTSHVLINSNTVIIKFIFHAFMISYSHLKILFALETSFTSKYFMFVQFFYDAFHVGS